MKNIYDIYPEQQNPGIEMQDVAKDIADAIHEAIKDGLGGRNNYEVDNLGCSFSGAVIG